MNEWLTPQELIDAAAQAGRTVTTYQLERWRRYGLLPRPTQQHAAGREGSQSYYPPHAAELLITICALRTRYGYKKLGEIAFRLWWDGQALEPEAAKAALASYLPWRRLAEPDLREVPSALEADGDEEEAFGDTLDGVVQGEIDAVLKRRSGAPLRIMRRRLRRQHGKKRQGEAEQELSSILYWFFLLSYGGMPSLEPNPLGTELREWDPVTVLVTALGLEGATKDKLGDNGPWLKIPNDTLPECFRTFRESGFQDYGSLYEAVESATADQVSQARNDAYLLVERLPLVIKAVEALNGQDFMGLGMFKVAGMIAEDTRALARLVAFCLLLRQMAGSALDGLYSATAIALGERPLAAGL